MAISQALLGEFEMEAKNTKRVIERVPDASADWRPHAKSFTLSHLAGHIVELHQWPAAVITLTDLDLADYKPPTYSSTAELVERLDKYVEGTKAALGAASDADFMVPWTLRKGDTVFFTMPRIQVIRGMAFNHFIHHRAQLTVYLRQLDIPVPGLYGPSADEM